MGLRVLRVHGVCISECGLVLELHTYRDEERIIPFTRNRPYHHFPAHCLPHLAVPGTRTQPVITKPQLRQHACIVHAFHPAPTASMSLFPPLPVRHATVCNGIQAGQRVGRSPTSPTPPVYVRLLACFAFPRARHASDKCNDLWGALSWLVDSVGSPQVRDQITYHPHPPNLGFFFASASHHNISDT